MPMKVDTKDCTALSDSELSEMADLCTAAGTPFDVGFLSKQCEEWVLVTQARDGGHLGGFSFCTLERIGGTPCVLVGLASFERSRRPEAVLGAIRDDQLRRAVLAFPDEDVLVGSRLSSPDGFDAFVGLEDVVPRPGHRTTGEERAWIRRLAKRFTSDATVNDRTFTLEGTGDPSPALDYERSANNGVDPSVGEFFDGVDRARGDTIVAFGWAMAEHLDSLVKR
jgi:hypothetical protein